MGLNPAFKVSKLLKKDGNGVFNNLNDTVLNVLMFWFNFSVFIPGI